MPKRRKPETLDSFLKNSSVNNIIPGNEKSNPPNFENDSNTNSPNFQDFD